LNSSRLTTSDSLSHEEININNSKIDKSEKDNVILRYYGIGAQIIKDLKIKNMILITKSPKKVIGLEGYDIKITKQELI